MGILKKLFLQPWGGSYADISTETVKRKRISHQLKREFTPRINVGIAELEHAVRMAQDPLWPDFTNLYAIYDQVRKDPHVFSQVSTALNLVLAAPFEVAGANGDYFARPWFTKFIKEVLMAEFWPHSLIEFGMQDAKGEFTSCKQFDRFNVNPERGEIVLRQTDRNGLPYREHATDYFLLEVMGEELGAFEIVARSVIEKRHAGEDWAVRSERFGQPFVSLKSTSRSDEELDEMEDMLANFGTSGYAILDEDDNVDLVESGKTDAHKIFVERMRYEDEQNSKVVNGQTMTSDDGSSYAQGQVHERILNGRTRSRMRQVQDVVNYQLMPFLYHHGYKVSKAKFEYTELKPKPKTQPKGEGTPLEKEDGEKKN